jgi:O-antigen ligase
LIFKILLSFVLSCTAGAAYSLALAINKPGPFGVDMVDITEMTNHAIGISHVYFNLYLGFCLIFICVFLFSEKRNSWFSVVLIPIGCFLLFFMFLLGGKMAIISLLILAVSTSGVLIVKKRKWVLGAALAIIPLAFFVFTILSVKDARARFEYLVNTENYFTGDNAWNSIGVRFSILKCVREVYLENPILGTGIGDVQNDLNECYEAKGYKTILDMNPHNQYFQFLLESGILGLVSYVLCILFIAIKANKSSNYLLSYFILMFSLCSLTESLLERQQGVMFFSYFLSFLACSFSSDPLKTSKTELKDGDIELNLRSVGEND